MEWILEEPSEIEERPHVTWCGGQAAFPGGWLEFPLANLVDHPIATRLMVWDGKRYVEESELKRRNSLSKLPDSPRTTAESLSSMAICASPTKKRRSMDVGASCAVSPDHEHLQLTVHSLDESQDTLQLADTVRDWVEQVLTDGRGWAAGAAGPLDAEKSLYVSIGTALAEKLRLPEEQVKQDYASDIVAVRHGSEMVGVLDCYTRTKTKSLVLKYALAHPDTQKPAHQRPTGMVGGVGRACLNYLLSRGMDEKLRTVRMEALSLKLYLSASKLGFEPIASKLPRVPSLRAFQQTVQQSDNSTNSNTWQQVAAYSMAT
mmetsp:Transcript_38855/g.72911  ORF Transcript_38855/g.72911 Transcript_38855/m.72911 type:complete len:318 (+) Transcript_38855:109-1062(+)